MVQVPYCCLSCYSSYHNLTCLASPKSVNSDNDSTTIETSSSRTYSLPLSMLIMDIFIKFYYLLVGNIKNVIFYVCHFLQANGLLFNRTKDYYHTAVQYKQRKEFFLRNMKPKNIEVVKVKSQSKRDNTLDRNHTSIITRTQRRGGKSTFLLVLLTFLNFVSTTQSVTAMVNKFVPPTSSSLPSITLQTSSSVSNSEQQTYPSHNNIEELYNKNINIETNGVNRNLNKRPRTLLKYKNTVSHQEGNYPPQQYHHTMKGGAIVVDLLSAFGLLHNISVHEPNVVLRPGAHSAAPAAVFSSSQFVSDSTARNVRLDLNHLSHWMYGDGSSSNDAPFVEDLKQTTHRLQKHSLRSKMQLVQVLDKLTVSHDGSYNSDSKRVKHSEDSGDTVNTPNHESHEKKRARSFSSKTLQEEPLELSIMASMKQEKGNSGTLFSLMHYSQSDGTHHRLLELQSSGRKNVLRVIYRAKLFPHEHISPLSSTSSSKNNNNLHPDLRNLDDIIFSSSSLHSSSSFLPTSTSSFTASSSSSIAVNVVENIPLDLADNKWHKIAVGISGNQLQVFLDCKSVVKRTIRPLDFRVSGEQKNISMWIGQQSQNQFYYKGYIQNFHLVSGKTNAHSIQCPLVDSDCPTCGEFRSMQELVRKMQLEYQHEISRLKDRLDRTEDKISKLEECDCIKSCQLPGGIIREDGASWSEGCQLCSCVHGVVTCRPPHCPTLNCTDPNPPDPSRGICCPSCKVGCQINNIPISHGSSHRPKRCVECSCDNGRISCTRQDPNHDCPNLNCPLSEQVQEEGECCKVCKADFCSRGGHNCHAEATCRNGPYNYTCHCRQGFIGNGFHCEDHNECDHIGHQGNQQGHFCTEPNSMCVNTIGSYKCECQSGYDAENSQGRLKCVPVNMCTKYNLTAINTNSNVSDGDSININISNHNETVINNGRLCNLNANCEDTGPGRYRCVCKGGYTGDGQNCDPICDVPCENGGHCIAPNQCQCPMGLTGSRCNEDIDECLLGPGVHKCGLNSRCVNKPGWHFCECGTGFRAYQDPLQDGHTICVDVDECELGKATCHQSTKCWNTEGSYQCYCQHGNQTRCSKDCLLDDNVLKRNGQTWDNECKTCSCNNGRVTCEQNTCDCNAIKNINYIDDDDDSTNNNNIDEENFITKCCSECFVEEKSNVTCTNSDGLTNHVAGETWLQNCQQCECKNGESDCWPMTCPPTYCPHPILLPGNCCPTCLNVVQGGCLKGNQSTTLPNNLCLHSGNIYQNGDSWPLIENNIENMQGEHPHPSSQRGGCTSCKCKVPFCDEQRVSRSAITSFSPSTSSSSSSSNKSFKLRYFTKQATR